ncbi:MAG TPA: type II toxin-antitoxin system PemK/MazF family toxin [Candidatus Dormibacteraeota bacterium]|nr:type II toxin-antitoxin system PemK/MazF family toxin [Candidatus Dormibacteraeota bacterium]
MVRHYVPEAGDIAWLDFDPQAGREQGRRRPALVLTEQSYNRASGLVVVCPLTSKRKPYPFALPVTIGKVEGAVLVDHIKSMDWTARNATFHSKGDPALLTTVRAHLGVLLRIQ